MTTIQATVNPRLLTKADRLFTGSLAGRVIEILQNARRAGATHVQITNDNGLVTVRDNGCGIEDFARLLDLGGSGWDEALESSEDPAGVGLFCLAPREVTIRSLGKMATICSNGWTGTPVEVQGDPDQAAGTIVTFQDDPWDSDTVDRLAVFCGMAVTVDGNPCPQESFVSDQAAAYPELGCRIEVRRGSDLLAWHHSSIHDRGMYPNVYVCFHGQVVGFDYRPVSELDLRYLVDLTGEPTGLRLMLPARTRMVENDALDVLRDALEREAYRFVQRRGQHALQYKEYLRARQLGIQLPEADPTFSVGLLSHAEAPEPAAVAKPDDFPLAKCYRFDPDFPGGTEADEANAHLLAALGAFDTSTGPFVPVDIARKYDGYTWAGISCIRRVELNVGRVLLETWLWGEELACVDSLTVTAHTSDGRVFSSAVCMAIAPPQPEKESGWAPTKILVTPQARERLDASEIWHHFGGWSEEGDRYDTQEAQFEQEMDRFWTELAGPDEQLRLAILESLADIQPRWRSVTVRADGVVTIHYRNGAKTVLRPPVPCA